MPIGDEKKRRRRRGNAETEKARDRHHNERPIESDVERWAHLADSPQVYRTHPAFGEFFMDLIRIRPYGTRACILSIHRNAVE
ncbi:MAG TPA: hypothetical protein VHC91_14020 [Trinickia sp.]|uniref:hypothetical protein n=1 Tax=Trinickia sp. TaxID=2571163 RepID=UPI002C8F2260|nr:hypothetical protein [Trinickia sp.]HVW51492.1 hypothetical protein [Trinickia sp.]